jgi:hypothetical protein
MGGYNNNNDEWMTDINTYMQYVAVYLLLPNMLYVLRKEHFWELYTVGGFTVH